MSVLLYLEDGVDWVVTIYRTHQLTVSNSLVGRIIGLRGAKINQIQVSWRKRECVCVHDMYNVCVCE